jgi:hypothetical protein
MTGLLETADRVHPQLAEREDYRQWLRMLRDMTKIRP